MMIERKITARLRGASSFDFSALAGAHALQTSVAQFMARGEREFTKLVPDLAGVDPDDSFSSVPYEKGFSLLYHLQVKAGARRPHLCRIPLTPKHARSRD